MFLQPDDHPQLRRLRALHADLLALPGGETGVPVTTDGAQFAERLHAFVQLLGVRLAAADPLLVWRGGLDALAGCLGNLLDELRAGAVADAPRHLASAAAFLDQAHAYLGALPTLGAAEGAGYLAAYVAAQREQHTRLLGACVSALDQAREALAGAGSELASVQAALAGARHELAGWQAQFAEAHARLQADSGALIAAQRQAFDEACTVRAGEFAVQLDAQRREGVRLLAELRELLGETRRAVAEELDQLATQAPTAQVAASFGRFADEERRIADRLRFVAGCFLASAGVLAVVFTLFADEPGRPAALPTLAVRMAGALALGLPGLYAAFESGRHRRAEARHRKSELDLHALDPVLRGLAPDKRERMREQITERIFSRRSGSRGL